MAKDKKTTNGRTLPPVDLMARIVAGVLAHAANKDSKQESKEKRICATNLTYYINPETKETTCVLQQSNGTKRQAKVRPMEGDEYDRDTGIILATLKTVSSKDRETREAIHHTSVKIVNLEKPAVEAPEAVELSVDEQPQQFASFVPQPDCGFTFSVKDGESFHFKPTGVDGVYISDCAVFKAPFDKDGCNDYEKSSGKKLLEQWFKEHAPAEIQEQFDIDLPTVEEVFSQKMINWWGGDSVKGLVSKQFPIFKDSDEHMKEFEGKPTWWWTRSAYAGIAHYVWLVYPDGSVNYLGAFYAFGFVPVLRRKNLESSEPIPAAKRKKGARK